MRTLALTTAFCAQFFWAASGCTEGSKSAADAGGSSEPNGASQEGLGPDATGTNALGTDAPAPDPRPCVAIPAACPTQQPSYARDIAPIFAAKCNSCHADESDGGPWPLTEWDYIVDWQSLIAADIEYCTMPPGGAPPLNTAEQEVIMAWLVCNAPNN
jgi:cytochrome c5